MKDGRLPRLRRELCDGGVLPPPPIPGCGSDSEEDDEFEDEHWVAGNADKSESEGSEASEESEGSEASEAPGKDDDEEEEEEEEAGLRPILPAHNPQPRRSRKRRREQSPANITSPPCASTSPSQRKAKTVRRLVLPGKALQNPFTTRPSPRRAVDFAGSVDLSPANSPHNLGRYRADFDEVGHLGAGNYGTARRCRHRLDGMWYAVKALPLGEVSRRRVMINEMFALAAFSHANIVRFHGAWLEGWTLYIQTELCDGGSLDRLVANRAALDPPTALTVLRDVASALAYIHDKGFVHLDVKPANILNHAGSYRLADLGLCCANFPRDGCQHGDANYLPILAELDAKGADLSKADVFALGISLLELLRAAPLPRGGDSFTALRRGRVAFPSAVPPPLATLVKDMMQEEAWRRPSAHQVVQRAQRMLGTRAAPTTWQPVDVVGDVVAALRDAQRERAALEQAAMA